MVPSALESMSSVAQNKPGINMRHSSDYESSDSTNTSPEKLVDPSPKAWFDLSWPVLGVIALFAGLLLALTDAHLALAAMGRVKSPFDSPAVSADRVLVVTANPDQQLQVIATLSPRGLEPLLARSLQDVNRQLAANGGAMRMAVVDGALADSTAIAAALKGRIAADRIVVLSAGAKREAIGQLLLDRM